MKKIIASAVGLVMLGGVAVTTASAFESKFGGYWRTRIFSQTDFNGVDSDYWRVDNRTRLYYTAIFNENFKFVNKFEFNTNWGDDVGGDIGADGTGILRIKNSYADFTLGNVRTKLGIQGAVLARGFIFDDDFSGVNVQGHFGAVSPSFIWGRVHGEYTSKINPYDDDFLAFQVPFKIGDMTSLNPYFVYRNSSNNNEDYYLGIDADMNFDVASAWGTFIWQGGTTTEDADIFDVDSDNSAYLFAVGAKASIVHGQFFYASGNGDGPLGGDDNEEFAGIPGRSYYWAEILGLGMFDNATSNGSPGNWIGNIWAANVGVKIKPMDKLSLGADLWYAALAEDNVNGDDGLGTELDLKAGYAIFDNLNLDVVFAYLFADDATGEEDPMEIGARLSLKF